ncbi:MAG: hypothetical protein IJG34_07100, partial [Synergistaceae bacterium]|nr:hypothetical protein [Synergistaceae bacterium]
MKSKYSASIHHDAHTIEQLYRTQYYAYDKLRIITRFIIGFVLIAIALFLPLSLWLRGILLLSGTWLVSSTDFPAQVRADKVIQSRHNNFPEMHYDFHDGYFNVSGEGSMNISYGKISRLIYDSSYMYIFMSRDSVCMIDINTLDDMNAFMKFIEGATNKEWHKEK